MYTAIKSFPCPSILPVEYITCPSIPPPTHSSGVLLYGPPGTGKTLLARAMAKNVEANFMKVVASAIVDKYIGESARVIREMFGMNAPILHIDWSLRVLVCWSHSVLSSSCLVSISICRPLPSVLPVVGLSPTRTGYAREHQPCIIFMDEIDAIGGRRFSDGNSSDREIQRTLMEV